MARTACVLSLLLTACGVTSPIGASGTTAGGTSSSTTSGSSGGCSDGGSVTCAPASLDFGSVGVDVQPPPTQTITCTNDACPTAYVSVNTGQTLPQFAVTDANGPVSPNTQHPIATNTTYVLTVAFEPTAPISYSSSFAFALCPAPTTCYMPESIPLLGSGGGVCQQPCPQGESCTVVDAGLSACLTVLSDGGTCPYWPPLPCGAVERCFCEDSSIAGAGCAGPPTCGDACCGHGGAADAG